MTEQAGTTKRPRHWKSNLFFVAVIVAASGVAFHLWKTSRRPTITYRETTVERGSIGVSVLATGTVQPENRLEIKPPIAGRIERVLVKEGERVKKGQILAWMSSTERAALIDAARSKSPEELKRWEELYRATPVLAPINGTIILRNVESGQTFTNTEAILVMSDRLTVKAQVDETDIAQIKLGMPAAMVLDAYQDHLVSAKVDQIAFEAKTVNNVTTYLVDVLPIETPDFMRAGMTANVTFAVHSKDDVLLVPNDALKTEDGVTRVLMRDDAGGTIEKPIKVGLTDGKRSEVLSGLKEREVILSAQVTPRQAKLNASSPFSPMAPGRQGGRATGSGGARGR